ncbi:HAMP domain-containing sensor histidine kinase [Hymenobacter saemangeumensis]|uniref:histidine kinase n=1 Tax=Hymenobacter saemangeumensis TaxID=1084522 RepID=A0ABP8IDY2_9BACT
MKRRIRSIFWLMVVCMVGINGFQAYWLYNTYQITVEQFGRNARETLSSVVQGYQLDLARQFVDKDPGAKDHLVVFQNINDEGQLDRVVVRSKGQKSEAAHGQAGQPQAEKPQVRLMIVEQDKNERAAFQIRRGRRAADTLARKLSKLLINNWGNGRQISLPSLTSNYRKALRLRGIEARLRLDTLSIPLRQEGRPAAAMRSFPQRAGFDLRTPPVLLNPFRELYVQASFEAPTFYILRQMSSLLIGSLLLLALTTGCFLLMLDTILKQRKLSEVKNDFINNMTHELKTPLATVSAAVEALQDFGALKDPRKTDSYLTIARQELRRLSDLVEKVLNIAVEERHDRALQLCTENVRPAELVAELVSRHQLQAPKPVRFEVDIPAQDTVRLDPLHVSGVINNLIDNAIKYSREQVTIAIRGRREGDGWLLSVSDDGLGIPRSYQDAIFDQFFRVPTGNLHPVKGFGLGLYYVRQVIERHGGRVSVRSEPNRGSAFSLWLPD